MDRERTGERVRAWAPTAASSLVALVTAGYLAVHLAPRYDEFHTLAYLQDPDLGSFWDSYRSVGDTLPPAAYVGSWLWSQIAGTSLLATRIPVVVAWAIAAGAVTAVTRRAGAWASFAAGLLATATSLVFLGAFARPYAPALALAALAIGAWQRAADRDRATGWLVATGFLFAAASTLHYAMAAVAVIVGLVTLAGGSAVRHRTGRALAPIVGGTVPILLSVALIPRAIDDQGRLDRSVRALDAAAFWPSTLRPALLPLAVVAIVVVTALAWPGDARRSTSCRLLDRELLRSGWALALAVPVVTVAAMALTSGTYVHRYTVGALLGGAIVAAEGVGRAARRWSWVGTVAAVAVLLGCGLAVRSTTGDMVSRAQADQLVADLALGRSDRPVVVIDEYDYLLLRHTGRAGRLELGTPPVVAHSPAAVDLAERLRHPEDGPIEVVGTPRAVEDLAGLEGWRVVGLGNGTYPRPIVQQVLAHVRLEPA